MLEMKEGGGKSRTNIDKDDEEKGEETIDISEDSILKISGGCKDLASV